MIENVSEMTAADFDDGNVPVDIWLNELSAEDGEWYAKGFRFCLEADNYMPRKGMVSQGALEVYSDNRYELQKLVLDHILPLYKIALCNINGILEGTNNKLYYWKESI